MSANHNQHHRTDIDGLRALAILPVLLFHARLGCPGGYVGVDVFFVISGYVITSLILRDQAEGVFSLTRFWERRIRRIIPPLALVLAATFVLGWHIFLPDDYQMLASSAIAQAALVSNVFFHRQMLDGNGYFAPKADTEPLLHTWSLSLEEQFYLFFPVLMILAIKYRHLVCLVAGLGLLSFLISLWYFVPQYFDPLLHVSDPRAFFFKLIFGYWHKIAMLDIPSRGGFYLLPSRAWELLLGSLLALHRGKLALDQGVREFLGWLGLGMIGFAVFCYDDKTPFPGVTAIPPCLGAALIIFSNEEGLCLTGRLLSFKPVIFIGLISYSLYLWHLPLLVFYEYPAVTLPGPWERGAVLAVSFVLATLSWKYVETPIRARKVFPKRRPLFVFAGCTSAMFLTLGFWVYSTGGAQTRLSPKVYHYAEFRNHFAFREATSVNRVWHRPAIDLGFTNRTPIDLILWGDSHAMAVAPVINDLCRKYSLHGALTAGPSEAPAVLTGYEIGEGEKMGGLPNAVLDLILQRHIKIVIMAARWSLYQQTQQFKQSLIFTVQTVLVSGSRVYVLRDVPRPGFNVPRLVAINAACGVDLNRLGTSVSEYSGLNKPMDDTFTKLSEIGATVLDPTPYFINARGIYGVVKDDQVLYCDDDHLSTEGAALLAPMFEPIFQTNAVLTSSRR